jgi:hypothetical protein
MIGSISRDIIEILANLFIALVVVDGFIVIVVGIIAAVFCTVLANRTLFVWRLILSSGRRGQHA